MINFFRKKFILAVLFGTVFFLGGASTAFGAEYYFRFHDVNIKPTVYRISPAYANFAECVDQQNATTGQNGMGSQTGLQLDSSCSSSTLDQQQAGVKQQQKADVAITEQDNGPKEISSFQCGISFTLGSFFRLDGCFPRMTYYFVYKPASFLLMGAGYIFDLMLSLSIEGSLVAPSFIDSTWTVVRDFSNMLFIFILLFAGVQTILGMGDWRKTVLNVVIMALLINFSLFFTKVVIDAGNILAVGIKNNISGGGNISQGLVGAFEPQMFLNKAGAVGPIDAIVVFIIAAIVSGFAGYILFKAAILFSRRLVVFWGLMVLSPFAFISIALPGDANKFNKWLHELISQAFVAPIFLFFLYVIATGLNASRDTLGSLIRTGGWFESLIGPIIIATVLVKALSEALEFAESMAGSTGAEFSGLVSKGLGLATGGAALAGQKTLGRAAAWATKQEGFKEAAAKSGFGRLAYSLTDKTAGAAFDARNLPGGENLGIGKGGGGSYVKTVEKAKKGDVDFGKKIATGKDGKPIKTMVDEWTTDQEGNPVKTGRKVEGTTTEAYKQQLEKGYAARRGTGGNAGAREAAKEIGKAEKKREKLAEKEAAKISDYMGLIGAKESDPSYDKELDSTYVEGKKKEAVEQAEMELAKAEAQVKYVETKLPDDTDAHAEAIVVKRKAEKKLKKIEGAQSEIDKIRESMEKLKGDKDGAKKEEKKDEKH